jgi:hypothetical protein
MHRRAFLSGLVVGGSVVLAGCSGGSELGTGSTPTTTDGGAADGGTGSNGGATSTTVPEDPGGTGGATPTAGSVAGQTLGEVGVQFENSFGFSVDASQYDGGGQMQLTGRWHGGDFYSRVKVPDSPAVEVYYVDGTQYVVTSGYCAPSPPSSQIPTSGFDTESWVATDEYEQQTNTYADLAASGTTTIDGEEMYVYEVTPEKTGIDSEHTYYVSVRTGYLRRVETQGLVLEYFDWGAVDPISAPC